MSGVAVAQDGEDEAAPIFNVGEIGYGIGSANVALFLTPDKSSSNSIAVGSQLDLVWLDFDILELSIDPALGVGVYQLASDETRFGPTLTIHADAPIQWVFEQVTGWVVSDETAKSIGEATELRLGATYAWEVDNDLTFHDPEARFVLMAGITLKF